MIKRSTFKSSYLPYVLILPQIIVTLTFFYWPAVQGLIQSFLLSDPFGQSSKFVWFYNYIEIFTDPSVSQVDTYYVHIQYCCCVCVDMSGTVYCHHGQQGSQSHSAG